MIGLLEGDGEEKSCSETGRRRQVLRSGLSASKVSQSHSLITANSGMSVVCCKGQEQSSILRLSSVKGRCSALWLDGVGGTPC